MARVSWLGGFAMAAFAVLALAAAITTLISAITTGTDAQARQDCNRECLVGEYFTCHYDFEVHTLQTYSWNCRTCSNLTCVDKPGCVQADGVTRMITAVNQQLPGPMIQVCKGDTVKVRVKNFLASSGVSIHWHGMTMKNSKFGVGANHMDGVPGVTQCLIMPNTQFTYTFNAEEPGTHLWTGQSGLHRADGVSGALIVRSAKEEDPSSLLYNEDLDEHVIMINDWTHIIGEEKFFLHLLSGFSRFPKSILINGQGPLQGDSLHAIPHSVKHQRFEVVKGLKYRFRLISAAFLNCPIRVAFQDHVITVIASDGNPVEPFNVTTITIFPGERWDLVLDANQYEQPYWITFTGLNDCEPDSVFQTAVLDYVPKYSNVIGSHLSIENRRKVMPQQPQPKYNERKPAGKELNGVNSPCDGNHACLKDLKSIHEMPENLKVDKPDVSLFLGFTKIPPKNSYTYRRYPAVLRALKLAPNAKFSVPLINALTFTPPSIPPIFGTEQQKACAPYSSKMKPLDAECLHLINIPIGSTTEIILADDGINPSGSVIHLHGHKFHVVYSQRDRLHMNSLLTNHTLDFVHQWDNAGLLRRNLTSPVIKDTIAIPNEGLAIIRFVANNPGYWILESQHLFDSLMGMKMILQVGEAKDIPKPPSNFPTCGNFL